MLRCGPGSLQGGSWARSSCCCSLSHGPTEGRNADAWNGAARNGGLRFVGWLRHIVRPAVGEVMNRVSLVLSIAAMVYLVYAMLRPERF